MNSYRQGRTRWPLLFALLILHGLVLIGLNRQPPAAKPQAVAMRLLRIAEKPRPLPREAPPPSLIEPAWRPSPLLLPTPEVVVTAAAPATAIAAAVPASASSSPQRLNLALPTQMRAAPASPTAREQALNDPRTNTAKVTVEYRIADAAGTLPITTQSTTDGLDSTMVRQGSKCTKTNKSRAATIDPMDERSRGFVSSSGDCFKK